MQKEWCLGNKTINPEGAKCVKTILDHLQHEKNKNNQLMRLANGLFIYVYPQHEKIAITCAYFSRQCIGGYGNVPRMWCIWVW